jgi:GT2 family glycosyltransferase
VYDALEEDGPATSLLRAERLAVVIITRDRAPELLHTLARLYELPERPRIVVVDQGSRDRTSARVRCHFPGVSVLELVHDRGAAGRTAGAQAVDAPFVAFCDDDSWWAPGALARGMAVLEANPSVAVVAGRVLLGRERRLDPACAAMAVSPLPSRSGLPGRRVLGFVACGAIVRRSAFLSVGGFDARLGLGAEEQLLATELASDGWDLVYCDDVLAYHHPSAVRDRRARGIVQVRNDLWFAWLRRRFRAAARITVYAACAAVADSLARAGLLQACRGCSWVLRSRRPVPGWLEEELRQLDRCNG